MISKHFDFINTEYTDYVFWSFKAIVFDLIPEFLTDKGLIAVTNLLSPDKISEAFIFMNMTKAQYDQICERNPPGVMRNLSLFRYALEHDSKSSKLDVLVTALTDVGEKALAEKIQHLFKNGIDLNDIRDW